MLQIYNPRTNEKLGNNTNHIFSMIPSKQDPQPLDVMLLREGVAAWDRDFAFDFPVGISSVNFREDKIEDVPVSLFHPATTNHDTPTIILIHGGGFCCELANVHKSLMASIIHRIPCHAILPHYCLSPENKAPKAINEISIILKNCLQKPEKYGITRHIIIVGYSSGGNLAWNALNDLISKSELSILITQYVKRLILMSPFLDLSIKNIEDSPYQSQQTQDKMLQPWVLKQMGEWFLPDNELSTIQQYSPIYQPIFFSMPQTDIIVGEFDVLLADAVKATELLRTSRIEARLIILEGQTHNHSAHRGLRDGVFTPDIIANLVRNQPINGLIGSDGFGLIIK